MQQQQQRLRKTAGVGQQFPVTRQSAKALQRGGIDHAGVLHGVGRLGRVNHAVRRAVAGNRRAAQTLQDAELDLMRTNRQQPVKTVGKTLQRFPRQAKDQIDMQVRVGVGQQPAQVGLGGIVVLPPGDGLLHRHVEGLHADFELQHARRELRQHGPQTVRQVVGDDFKVQKEACVRTLRRLVTARSVSDAAVHAAWGHGLPRCARSDGIRFKFRWRCR